jgi:hypothetical protein
MPALKKPALLALALLLPGCQTMTPISVTDTSCRGFVPILYSRKDTPGTIQQAREHNAAWDALCKAK